MKKGELKMQVRMCDKCKKKIYGRGVDDNEQKGSSRGKFTVGNFDPFFFDLCRDCTKELAKFFGIEWWIEEDDESDENG